MDSGCERFDGFDVRHTGLLVSRGFLLEKDQRVEKCHSRDEELLSDLEDPQLLFYLDVFFDKLSVPSVALCGERVNHCDLPPTIITIL
eukprot:745706-Hanusia_phi.AAC.4